MFLTLKTILTIKMLKCTYIILLTVIFHGCNINMSTFIKSIICTLVFI